jgi:hypothetical protein
MDESILEQVNTLIELYGLPTAIVVILIVLLITLVKSRYFADLTFKFFKKWINNRFKRKEKKTKDGEAPSPTVIKVTESDVINHEIFNHIDFWLYSHIPTVEFSTKYRTVVFRKYLHIYFKAYKDTLHIFVNSGNYKKMDDSELRQALMKLITDTIYKYESEMALIGIPPVIINKMKAKNNDTLNLTIDLINSICDSRFYNSENNLLKVFSLLNIILSILENTIANSVEVCDSINGELKGLSMDGFTEGDDD